jgi:hypothetical protein
LSFAALVLVIHQLALDSVEVVPTDTHKELVENRRE